MKLKIRTGFGYDVHQLQEGLDFWLGGIKIPHTHGALGHSDADVLLHALINALLGAMAEGDIGTHFPDSDPRYKNIESAKLLGEVLAIMRRKRFKLVNADVTLIAQEPKLAPYYAAMRTNVAGFFKVKENRINIKASTTEKLGWAGKGEGMAATVVVLLQR